MTSDKNNMPAFPHSGFGNLGLSKREYIAALALTSLGNATMGWVKDKADIDQVVTARAEMAVLLADALIKRLAEASDNG
jgi:hypothetical protein